MTNKELYLILNYFSSVLSFVTLFFSIRSYRFLPKYLLPIFILTIANALTETIVFIGLTFYKQLNPVIVLKFFTATEFALISVFYAKFFGQYFKTYWFYIVIPCFFVLNIVDYNMNGPKSSDHLSVSFESICFILYSLFLFYYVLRNLLFENLLGTSVFWINSAILFYFAGSLFLFVFSSYILGREPLNHLLLWATIHTFFNLVYNLFLGIGFWKMRSI